MAEALAFRAREKSHMAVHNGPIITVLRRYEAAGDTFAVILLLSGRQIHAFADEVVPA